MRIDRIHWLLQSSLRRIRALPGLAEVERMAAAAYAQDTDTVCAVAQAGKRIDFFDQYDFQLAAVPGLALIAAGDGAPAVNSHTTLPRGAPLHAQALFHAGMRSGLTAPINDRGALIGFLFLNAARPGYFSTDAQRRLSAVLGDLRGLLARELKREREVLTLVSSRV